MKYSLSSFSLHLYPQVGYKEALSGRRKKNGTLRGVAGVQSWTIGDTGYGLYVMFSIPYDHVSSK